MSTTVSASRSLSRRLSQHTLVYGVHSFITFAFAIVNVAVLTRYLSLPEYGRYGLLMIFAASVTLFANLVTLQGTFSWVFGAGDVEAGSEDEEDGPVARSKRAALTTGLLLTVLVCAVIVGASFAFAGPAAEMIVGENGFAYEFKIAAVSGALGSIARFVSNTMRYERRPVAYVVLTSMRPVLVVGLSVPLVADGGGVKGALMGTVLGTAASALIGLIVGRRSFGLLPGRGNLREIGKRGSYLVPVIVSLWGIHHMDLYVLSRVASDADVARYRVASRLGAGVSYFISAFLMAWTPLARTVTQAAADKERGRSQLTATIFTYFCATSMWICVALTVLADGLIHVAPGTYGPAAPLIPIIGAGFVAYGVFVVLHRGLVHKKKRAVFVRLTMLAAVIFLVLSIVLGETYGVYGVAIAPFIAFSIAAVALAIVMRRGTSPLPLEYLRLLALAGMTAVCLGLSIGVAPLLGPWRLVLDVAVIVVLPLLMVRVRIISPEVVGKVIADLRPAKVAPIADPTAAGGPVDAATYETFTQAVRERAGVNASSEGADESIGRYLLSRAGVAQRDAMARSLLKGGVDPAELYALELAAGTTVRRTRRSSGSPTRHRRTRGAEASRRPLVSKRRLRGASMSDPKDPEAAVQRAAAHWSGVSSAAGAHGGRWWHHDAIVRHINERICGQPVPGMTGADVICIREALGGRPPGRGISVGCGSGQKELALLRAGVVESFDLYEVSDKRVEIGRELARKQGLESKVVFHQEIIDFADIGTERYDLVYWNNALHHMLDTRAALRWSREVLRPGGVFHMNDFVGPTRMQWPDEMLAVATRAREGLPERLLAGVDGGRPLPTRVTRPSLEGLIARDPTECADSENIIPGLAEVFPSANLLLTGGVVYHLALSDVLSNMSFPEDEPVLKLLLLLDDVCADGGMTHYGVATATVPGG